MFSVISSIVVFCRDLFSLTIRLNLSSLQNYSTKWKRYRFFSNHRLVYNTFKCYLNRWTVLSVVLTNLDQEFLKLSTPAKILEFRDVEFSFIVKGKSAFEPIKSTKITHILNCYPIIIGRQLEYLFHR